MKRSNKTIPGLIAGAAIGVLTFMYVKPKFSNKKGEQTPQGDKVHSAKKYNPEHLFI